MKTFFIDSDNNISVFSSVEEAGAAPGLERFDFVDQFRALAKHLASQSAGGDLEQPYGRKAR